MLITVIANPILQFGTSRFLLAHLDLFVSQALAHGQALGPITVVQSTGNTASLERVAALNAHGTYPVRIRGLRAGQVVDETLAGTAVQQALDANQQWPQVVAAALAAQVMVSNTADAGYALHPTDSAGLLTGMSVPRSFPAKLLVLLHARWQHAPVLPLSIFPCELTTRNGDTLRAIVMGLAGQWNLPADFVAYLGRHCKWANSLVDRIVSEPIHPVGAIAEPYALWAVERQPGLMLPCTHASIVLTDQLETMERLKLHLLNLGHTWLAEGWLAGGFPQDMTVLQAMNDPLLRAGLESVWAEEVLPVFEALGEGGRARDYVVDVRERLLNPFLVHRIAEIAQNHEQKKQRRFAPVLHLAGQYLPTLSQPSLRLALEMQGRTLR